ncbi:MAG TPA: ribonuclease H [Gemmatimonadaceae bacterium]|nr:ribonuclease H [Gemmatimonadaceae bacterium]
MSVRGPGERSPDLIAVFADESCLGNGRDGDNPGGAGALIEYRQHADAPVRSDLWISDPATTNNRMALQSVIETMYAIGTKGARFRIVFTTDSRYIIDGLTDWVHGWAKRGWRRKGGAIENLELWHEAIRAVNDHEVCWRWVRGHDGHAQNEYANYLATRAAATQTRSDGLVTSGFTAWLAAARDQGARHADPSPFPDAVAFRPHAPLPEPND